MRRIVASAAFAFGLAGITPSVAAAPAMNYPWCTSGAGHEFGAVTCGFTTFEQCLETARGNGQSCNPNPLYVPPPAAPARRARHRTKTSR